MGLSDGMTPADIGAICGNNGGAFGGDNGAWWIIILFLFAFCGWGNNNGGGFGGSGAGYISDNYALISDNATLERKIDGVYAGICDSTFALNNTINNGFASAQNTMTQGFAGLNTGMVQQGYEGRIATQGVQNAVQSCCCDLRDAVSGVNYNMAMNTNTLQNALQQGFCQTNFNGQTNTRDIIASQDANTRAILDAIQANKVEALKDRISEQNQMITSLNLAASQARQNEYLVDKLGYHCPQAAYVVQPPQQVTFPTSCCGVASYNNSGCQYSNI